MYIVFLTPAFYFILSLLSGAGSLTLMLFPVIGHGADNQALS
jgi:anaerobic C4-dicarboxylate transporter